MGSGRFWQVLEELTAKPHSSRTITFFLVSGRAVEEAMELNGVLVSTLSTP